MDKSEALFLADELEAPLGTVIGAELYRRAAEELRRLHAQRNALLEALKEMLEYSEMIEERCDAVATNKARAAIALCEGPVAAAEGETK